MNQYRFLHFFFWAFLSFSALSSCVNPTQAGLDLLDEDLLNLVYVDSFTVETTSELSDSVRTHTPNTLLSAYILGRMDDPIFGLSEAGLYAQLIPEYLNPKFDKAIVDSVVLILPYDTTKFYGNPSKPIALEVFQLLENINPTETHFSNARYAYAPTALGRGAALPSKDSVAVFDYAQSVLDTIAFPHLRIPIDRSIGQELLNLDTSYYTTDSLFQTFFRGIYIKPTTQSGSMAGINLGSTKAGMIVYYRTDTLNKQFQYQFSPYVANVPVFKHTITGKPVEKQLGAPSTSNPYFFAQGLGGVNGKIRVPNIRSLKNVIVNHAILELRVASLDGDDLSAFPPASTLVVYYRDADGVLQVVPDVSLADTELSSKFGGTYQAGADPEPGLYRMNLSAHVQDMVEGKVSNELLISLLPKAENSSRVILYGAGSPAYKAKLKIAFTELNK